MIVSTRNATNIPRRRIRIEIRYEITCTVILKGIVAESNIITNGRLIGNSIFLLTRTNARAFSPLVIIDIETRRAVNIEAGTS